MLLRAVAFGRWQGCRDIQLGSSEIRLGRSPLTNLWDTRCSRNQGIGGCL